MTRKLGAVIEDDEIEAYVEDIAHATCETHPRPCVAHGSNETHSKHLSTKTLLISTYLQQHY